MSKIFASNNLSVGGSGIKWNIKASTDVPVNQIPGKPGDIIVVTDRNIKKLKYVATKNASDVELQNNSINVYEDFNQPRMLVNENNGFKMYMYGISQNIVLNEEVIVANVYFYDGLTEQWIPLTSAYREALNVNSFTGQNINIDELWSIDYTDNINEEGILPTIVKPQATDVLTVLSFTGQDIDIDTYWDMVTITDTATLRTSSLEENDDIIIN